MRLTVVGNSSRYLAPLGTGATYLVEHAGTRVLLDAGNGTFLRLDGAKPDALVVSHFHQDYVMDLIPVLAMLDPGTSVFLADRARGRLNELLHATSSLRRWGSHLTLRGAENGTEALVGSLALRFARAYHGCPGIAVRVEPRDGSARAICYLSDTGWRPWLVDLARGAGLLVAHSLALDGATGDIAEHNLTAGAVGRLAASASVERLALSHVPFYAAADASVAEARAHFGSEVIVLREGQSVTV